MTAHFYDSEQSLYNIPLLKARFEWPFFQFLPNKMQIYFLFLKFPQGDVAAVKIWQYRPAPLGVRVRERGRQRERERGRERKREVTSLHLIILVICLQVGRITIHTFVESIERGKNRKQEKGFWEDFVFLTLDASWCHFIFFRQISHEWCFGLWVVDSRGRAIDKPFFKSWVLIWQCLLD